MSMSRSFTVYSLSLLLNELNTSGLNGRKVTINLATECQGLGGGNGDKMGGMETFALLLDRPPPPPCSPFQLYNSCHGAMILDSLSNSLVEGMK